MTETLTLVSHHLCPYVQRVAIALAERDVPFERLYIDLADKPAWFKAMSPLGKVPLLKVGEEAIFESVAILEYLEEALPHPLHPVDALTRARHRAWIEFGASVLSDIGALYSAPDQESFEAKAKRLKEKFDRIEAELDKGPWFAGENFSLIDTVFGPVFRYFDVFDGIDDFGILSDKPKVKAWRNRLAARPSIKSAVKADYPDRLMTFLEGRKSYLSRLIDANAPILPSVRLAP